MAVGVMRLISSGIEDDRLPKSLEIKKGDGVIESFLTCKRTGQERSMNFEAMPLTIRVNSSGGWS